MKSLEAAEKLTNAIFSISGSILTNADVVVRIILCL
jgi:hypothetical protein